MSSTPKLPATLPAKCSTCLEPLASPLFCSSCHCLQALASADHFEILGLPRTYDLDPELLRRTHLAQSLAAHPDRAGDSPDNQAVAQRAAARINEARRVLADPLLRAEYLLELAGGDSAASDKSTPPDVLSQTLMLREEWDEAVAAGDAAAQAGVRRRVFADFESRKIEIAALARRLPADADLRRRLRSQLNAVRYQQRLLDLMQEPQP